MTGQIHSFESFGTVDGPGIRFVVFMQGCPMRCQYCHNPDTWNFGCGKAYTAEKVVKEVLKYKNYISGGAEDNGGATEIKGGVTVSGGEPLMQIDFVTELFRLLKQEGIHTALDTSGITFNKTDENSVKRHKELLKYTDLVLLDIKHIDDEKHRAITRHSNEHPLDFARFVSDSGVDMWIRHVLVPDLTDNDESLKKLRKFIDGLKTVKKVEVLPYHTMGEAKYEKLGVEYPLKGVQPPTKERISNAVKILTKKDDTYKEE